MYQDNKCATIISKWGSTKIKKRQMSASAVLGNTSKRKLSGWSSNAGETDSQQDSTNGKWEKKKIDAGIASSYVAKTNAYKSCYATTSNAKVSMRAPSLV